MIGGKLNLTSTYKLVWRFRTFGMWTRHFHKGNYNALLMWNTAFWNLLCFRRNNKNWRIGYFGIHAPGCSSLGMYLFFYGFLTTIIRDFQSIIELILNSSSLPLPSYRFGIVHASTLNERCSFYFHLRKLLYYWVAKEPRQLIKGFWTQWRFSKPWPFQRWGFWQFLHKV